ncbi:MAG: sugar phosphate isomerase/epimerase [Deltaproteobacteria bacterium]|nr:sugar phosphate isomerase/epimerase [Deltaproteobacteria bacterium]
MLAPYLDEIELVLFESGRENNLPSPDDIEHLVTITKEQGLTYHVHLPIDIFLGDPNPGIRARGVGMIQKIITLTSPLEPSTYTLHLSLNNDNSQDGANFEQWKMRLCSSIEEILKTGVAPTKISVETLDYPFELIEDVLEAFGLSVCLDLGHLILYGHSIADYVKRYLAQTTVVHLHGVKDGTDHLSLDVLGKNEMETICGILKNFSGIVSIEIFSFHDLRSSLMLLEKWCQRE